MAKSQSANQVKVTLSRQIEKYPKIGTIVHQKLAGKSFEHLNSLAHIKPTKYQKISARFARISIQMAVYHRSSAKLAMMCRHAVQ